MSSVSTRQSRALAVVGVSVIAVSAVLNFRITRLAAQPAEGNDYRLRYYLFLPNGYPGWRAEDETERLAWLMQNPLLGVYDNIHNAIAANDAGEKATLERIRMNGSPRIVRAHSVSVY